MNEAQPIVVLGARGTTGRRVAAALRVAGHPVRAASRSSPVRFDWTDPATWHPTLHGARALYLMAPEGQAVEPAFVERAVAEGVERIVLLSSEGIEAMHDERLLAAEATVRAAATGWTIVRADWFNQNFDEGFLRPGVMAGRVTLPLGDTAFPFVDAEDIAAVAVAALTEPDHDGQTHVVTGPWELTLGEAAETVAQASGRRLTWSTSPDAFLSELIDAGLPADDARAQLAAFDALAASSAGTKATDTVRTITGRDPIPFPTYAARAAAAGAWAD